MDVSAYVSCRRYEGILKCMEISMNQGGTAGRLRISVLDSNKTVKDFFDARVKSLKTAMCLHRSGFKTL